MKILLFIAALSFPLFAQTPCKLTLKQSPVVRGLKLGMPKTAAAKILGTDKTVSFEAIDLMGHPNMEGVKKLTVGIGVDNIFYISVNYDPEIKWSSIREYTANLSRNLGLPKTAWAYQLNSFAEMTCTDFWVQASVNKNYLTLQSRESPEYKKQHFKP